MSLASAYAELQTTVASDLVTANEGVPSPFVGPNGRAEVTITGGLRLVPTGTGSFEISAAGALLFAQRILDTFGDP